MRGRVDGGKSAGSQDRVSILGAKKSGRGGGLESKEAWGGEQEAYWEGLEQGKRT